MGNTCRYRHRVVDLRWAVATVAALATLAAGLAVISPNTSPARAADPGPEVTTGARLIGVSHWSDSGTSLALTADGRYAVYVDWSNRQVDSTWSGQADLYRYDTTTGERVRLTVTADPDAPALSGVGPVTVSADGSYVAFISDSTELVADGAPPATTPVGPPPPTDAPTDAPTDVPTDTPTDVPTDTPTDAPTPPGTPLPQVYVAHVDDGEVELTRLPLPDGSANGVDQLSLSADGRRVAFVDSQRDPVRGELLGVESAYVMDWQTSTDMRRLDLSGDWPQTGVDHLNLSADGSLLAASVDTGEDTYVMRPVIYDLTTGAKTVGPLGGYKGEPVALSADGEVVGYATFAWDEDGYPVQGINTWRWQDEATPVSLPTPIDRPYPSSPTLSRDGSLVVYDAGQRGPYENLVYAQARTSAKPTLLSRTDRGTPAPPSYWPTLSADGNAVLFTSTSPLLPGAGSLDDQAIGIYYLPLVDTAAPTWPNGAALTVTDREQTSLTITWPDADDDLSVARYRVYVDDVQVADLPATTTGYRLTGIDAGEPYRVSVRALDGSGHLSSPLTAGFYPAGQAPLSAVAGPTGAVDLHWESPLGQAIDGFRVLRAEGATGVFDAVADLAATQTTYTDDGLTSATQYRYRVDLRLSGGSTERWTAVQSVQTPVFAARLVVRTPAGAGSAGGFRITVTDSDGAVLLARDIPSGVSETPLGPLPSGRQVTVTADLIDRTRPYVLHHEAELTLRDGDNVVTFAQQPLPTTEVTGTLTDIDGGPVADSPITLTVHTEDGRDWPTATVRTGTDGHFSATVLAGYLTVETGARPRGSGGDYWTGNVGDGPNAPIELRLADGRHRLRLALATADYGGAYTKQDLDFRTIADFEVTLTDEAGADIPIRGNTFDLTTFTHELTLCANGWRVGLNSSCHTFPVDPWTYEVELGVNLTQVGVVTGALVGPDGEAYAGRWQGALTPLDEDGNAIGATLLVAGYGAALRVGIPAACTCRLVVTAYADTYTAFSPEYRFSITAGEGDLGAVALVRNPTVGMTSAVTAAPQIVQPGQLLSVRAEFTTPKNRSLSSAVARLGVPVGTTVPRGGVTVDGQPVDGTLQNGYYEVPVGHVDNGTTTVVRYTLQIGQTTTPGTLSALVWVRHDGDVLEPIGTATAQVLGVQLYAPQTVNETSFTVRGTAPAGALVTVREGANVHAQVQATAGGLWSATVDLGEPIPGVSHTLRAGTVHGGATLNSPYVTVTYDDDHPQPTSITVGQPSGRAHTFDPALGTAVFTFVYWPDEPVQVSASFASTDRLRNVVAHVGQSSARMTCGTTTCTADVMARNETVGDVWIDYDVAPVPYASPGEITLPSPSQLASMVNTPYGQLEITRQSGNTFEGTVGGQPFRTTITVSEADAPADWGELGGSIPGWFHSETAADGDDLRVTQQIAVPLEWLDAVPDGGGDPLAARSLLAPSSLRAPVTFAPAAVGSLFAPASKVVSITSDFYGLAKPALVDGWLGGTRDPWDRLGDLFDVISDSACAPATKKELTDFVTGEGKWVLAAQLGGGVAFTLLGAVAAPVTLLGQVLNFGVGLAGDVSMGSAADYVVNNAYNQVRRVMDQRDCNFTDPPARPKVVYAHPTYIFDPSGRVYDAVTGEPLADVTATIQSAPGPDGPWTQWDAAAFGQDNAQATDAFGRYGWFVPVGWWRVTYEKDGYHPATSAVMQVLPEHTDVDIALQPIAPPAPGDDDSTSSTGPGDPSTTQPGSSDPGKSPPTPGPTAPATPAQAEPGRTTPATPPQAEPARPARADAGPIASTGFPALSITGLGVLLLLVGGAALAGVRWRRRPQR